MLLTPDTKRAATGLAQTLQGEAALRGEEERLARQRRDAQVREAQEKLARIRANLKEGEAQQQVGSLTLPVLPQRHVIAGS